MVCLFLIFLTETNGQCPTIILSSTSGNTCGIRTIMVSGNTFGGSATKVTITENGSGSVSPASSTKSPFSFTYLPKTADIGKTITITVITNDPKGSCTAAKSTYTLIVSAIPAAPVIGTITQPACSVPTGSVVLTGLPAGAWNITSSPGEIKTAGSSTSMTLSGLQPGSYTFTVANAAGCASAPSPPVIIHSQPAIPEKPIGLITQPTCILSTGSVSLSGLPSVGTWTLIRSPGNYSTTGTGEATTITGLPWGTFTFSVINSSGCASPASASIVITEQPAIPPSPSVGAIVQPRPAAATGSVVLSGLPGNGSWLLTRLPDNVAVMGSGSTITISALSPGIYYFSVTNQDHCTSVSSEPVIIGGTTDKPVIVINFPAPVCFPVTVDLTEPKITSGSTPNMTYTYWTDALATVPLSAPNAAISGTWYIKGTLSNGKSAIEPVMVIVFHKPSSNAGVDQFLLNQKTAQLDAELINNYETGIWSVISGRGEFFDPTIPKTTVSGLSENKNTFTWKVTNGICPSSSDTVIITLRSQIIPTLITPNMDGKNDYLVAKGFEASDKIELVVFDRRGVEVYRSENYDNNWNGIDMNGQPLEEDTYYYVLKTYKTESASGYVVIRR